LESSQDDLKRKPVGVDDSLAGIALKLASTVHHYWHTKDLINYNSTSLSFLFFYLSAFFTAFSQKPLQKGCMVYDGFRGFGGFRGFWWF
jgi:hypothetical protein